jgi:hypothetical protein
MTTPPFASPPTRSSIQAPAPGVVEDGSLRARLRRFVAAWLLGAAIVVWPAWPTAEQERAARRPAFERALTWRDFIRMRLSPWLLMQHADRPGEPGGPPTI